MSNRQKPQKQGIEGLTVLSPPVLSSHGEESHSERSKLGFIFVKKNMGGMISTAVHGKKQAFSPHPGFHSSQPPQGTLTEGDEAHRAVVEQKTWPKVSLFLDTVRIPPYVSGLTPSLSLPSSMHFQRGRSVMPPMLRQSR